MEYISAPWREEYVKKAFKMRGCIFCRALERENDRETYILYRGAYNFIILNRFPYTPGHLMIAPYQHLGSFEQSRKKASDEMADLLKLSLKVLKEFYKPHGFNTGMNIGQSAGAGVTDHYHLHVIPRWVGDSNFMPIVSQTKIVFEDLRTTYERLSPLFPKNKRAARRT